MDRIKEVLRLLDGTSTNEFRDIIERCWPGSEQLISMSNEHFQLLIENIKKELSHGKEIKGKN